MTTVNIHTQVADVLAAARALIEERGLWNRRVLGSLYQASAATTTQDTIWLAARRALLDATTGGRYLREWCYAPGRTKEEVLAAFETAEANERKRAEA